VNSEKSLLYRYTLAKLMKFYKPDNQ